MSNPLKLIITSLCFSFSLLLITNLALNQKWSYHLEVDAKGFYYSRAQYFLAHKNLTNLGYNEYQPGAVMFFIALSPSLLWDNTNTTYITTLIIANLFLATLLACMYVRQNSLRGLAAFTLLLPFAGPIVLYRFEFYVTILIISALLLWQKKHYLFSLAVLGAATMVKIFPLLLLPYFLLLTYKKSGFKTTLAHTIAFAFGALFVVITYTLMFKVPLEQLSQDASIHAKKPVHVESLWGSVITLLPKITENRFARGEGAWGIYGIAPQDTPGTLGLYNYSWIVVLCLFYLYLAIKLKSSSRFRYEIIICILLLFLSFSKILTGQYILWATLLIPLLKYKQPNFWNTTFVLCLAILGLGQYVYPLKYNELLGIFYVSGGYQHVFWMLALRNLLLLVLTTIFFIHCRRLLTSTSTRTPHTTPTT